MASQDKSPAGSWLSRLLGAKPEAPKQPGPAASEEPEAYDPFEQDPAEALPWAASSGPKGSRAESEFLDVTRETLAATRQEVSRSLERDRDDPFFWIDARPDAVAGMAKVFLRERCASRYWQAAVGANSYALWGAVLMARELARSRSEPCGRGHLAELAGLDLRDQAAALDSLDASGRAKAELARAEGMPMPGCWMGEAHKQAGLRSLFSAALQERPVSWPDLPARLTADDAVPDRLPGLLIDLRSLEAEPADPGREEAQKFWSRSFDQGGSLILWVPDWASWLLAPEGAHGLRKIGAAASPRPAAR